MERGRFYFLSFRLGLFDSSRRLGGGEKDVWGRRRDDDDACVREKEGGRRAMTVLKKKRTPRASPLDEEIRRASLRNARDAGGRTAAGTRAFDMYNIIFIPLLVINFLRRSSFFRLLSLRSPFFFAPIFFPSFFSSCPSLRIQA